MNKLHIYTSRSFNSIILFLKQMIYVGKIMQEIILNYLNFEY